MATRKSELVITCNAKAVKDVFEYLNRQLADVKQKLKDLNAKGEKSGWTEQMKKDFRDLTKQATAIDSAIIKNQQSMVKYGQVLKDLSGSKLKDLKSALREANTSLNKMSEKSPGREKLINDIKRIKEQISGTSGLTMSFRQAQTQLKNLDGTSMDKLKQGLAAIKAQLDNPNIGNKWRRSLEQMQQQYQAAMAVRTAPMGVMPVANMNAQQLGAERTALMSAIAATSGVKGYENKTAGYEQRLKAINEQLTILSDKEKKAAADAKQLQATQEAAKTVQAVYRGQAVSLDKLNAAYQTLQARANQFAASNPAKAKVAQQQMVVLKRRIDQVTAAMQAEIKIDKQFLKTATNQMLQTALTQLQQKLQSLNSTQSSAARKLKADMKAVEKQIKNNTGAIKQQGNTFGTAIKNIAAYVGVFGAFNMIKSKITEVYKSNLKLSDSLADIRKVSGLTSEEINKLYTNISKIDSRNTIETLNKLAYTGAKLGIGQNYGVEGLTGFVRAAEQVQMALGEDLGEEALPALAKLTEVMNLIPRYGVEQAMQKAASAIFQLGATSTATGKNIVEFSKRLMGLANVSRVSADELLAIGSAADAMGLMPEVAATAFNKLFTSIQKGHNMIEKSLGLVQGSINENFTKGKTIQSIIDIFDAMNKKGNMNALDGIFKDLGSDGARLVAVMTTMADRVDILKKHLATSTAAFKDGTAVINEYMIQNETAQALMQRASNLWTKAFTNPEGIDMVKQLAEQWYEVSKSLTQSESSMYVFHDTLEKITNTVIGLVKILPFLIKMLTWMGIFGGIRMLANSFYALVVAINAARTATASLQVLLNSNWVLAGVSAVVAGVSLFIDKMNAAAEAAERAKKRQDELDKQLLKSKEKIGLVVAPLESYKKALDESNKSLDERNRLLKELLKSDYQQYLDYLGIEIDGAIDLAKAYAMVVKVLKQKKAYEEREQYRDEVNSENKMERMRSGMRFDQVARRIGVEGIDQNWLDKHQTLTPREIANYIYEKATGGSKIWHAADAFTNNMRHYYKDAEGNTREAKEYDEIVKTVAEYRKAWNAEFWKNYEVNQLYKNEVGDFDMEKFNEEVLKAQLERKGNLSNLKPDKEEEKLLKKEQQEEKKRLKDQMDEAEKDSTAVINAIEEFYRLQESAVEQLVADGKMTREEADKLIEYVKNRKDLMLMNARRAIAGKDSDFEKLRKDMGKDMLRSGDVNSQRALNTVQTIDVAEAAKRLQKFDGSKNVYDLNAGSFTQAMLKNAAQNELNIQRRQAKVQEEIDKILMQYEFVEQAQKTFGDKLVKLGLVTDGYDKVVQQLADGTEIVANTKDVQNLADKVVKMDSRRMYGVDTDDALELRNMIDALMHTVDEDGKKIRESFASMFPNLDEWMEKPEQFKEQMQAFYKTLIDMDADYYKALKQNYEQEKRVFTERWQSMGWTEQEKMEDMAFENQANLRKIQGEGENFGQTYGFADTIADDPEIKRLKARMEYRAMELQDLKDHNATEQAIMTKQNEMLKEAAALAEKVSAEVANRISKVQTLSEPLNDWGEEVGTMLGEMWQGISREGKLTFGQMAQNMGLEYAKLTLKMASENLMKKLQQGLFYKQMELQEMQHQVQLTNIQNMGAQARIAGQITTGTALQGIKAAQDASEIGQEGGKATIMTMFGISEGAAKTIAKLGFWGIPLIGVITSILMGLLNSAKATAGQESSKSSTSNSNTKTKLVSNMLTYDKGNVQRFIGQDGKVYTATEEPAPKDGLVTHPIATTVQGQPALVAEKGPEIVIGRETTKAIMMNEPELIRYLANYQQHGGRRLLDSGNVEYVAMPSQPAEQGTDAEREALRQQMSQMQEVMNGVLYYLQHPVRPKINMYSESGEDGLYDSMKKATKFMARYGG